METLLQPQELFCTVCQSVGVVCVRARQVVSGIIVSIRAYESLRNGSRFLLLLCYL